MGEKYLISFSLQKSCTQTFIAPYTADGNIVICREQGRNAQTARARTGWLTFLAVVLD